MIFTPGERRLIASLVVFLGSAYLISGLRACHLLPAPAPDRAARAVAPAAPRVSARDETLDEVRGDRRDDPGEDPSEQASGDPREAPLAGGYLDLNAADSLALIALPGIGPALAGRILTARARRGHFDRLEDLHDVRGIGEKRLEKLREYLVVRAMPPG